MLASAKKEDPAGKGPIDEDRKKALQDGPDEKPPGVKWGHGADIWVERLEAGDEGGVDAGVHYAALEES